MDNAFSILKKPATLTMAEETNKETPLYYRYWGKARPDADNGGPAYHFYCRIIVWMWCFDD
jgi:hypothetical protein